MSQDTTDNASFNLPEYDNGFLYKKLFEINDNVLKLTKQMVFANNDNMQAQEISQAVNQLWENRIVPYLSNMSSRITSIENKLAGDENSSQPETSPVQAPQNSPQDLHDKADQVYQQVLEDLKAEEDQIFSDDNTQDEKEVSQNTQSNDDDSEQEETFIAHAQQTIEKPMDHEEAQHQEEDDDDQEEAFIKFEIPEIVPAAQKPVKKPKSLEELKSLMQGKMNEFSGAHA